MSDEIVVERNDHAVRFLPFGGRVERELRRNRFYEHQMLGYLESLALEGGYADIGAYVGTHALFFARYCPATTVYAFEPRGHVFEFLRRHVELNNLGERIRPQRLGLSDRAERVTITFEGRTEEIPCERLDDVIDGPVSVLKIDVEGMEEKVIAGAARTLREHRPLILIEAHTEAELARDLAALAPYGYRATGRVFNDTPTYELAAPDSPTVPASRLPVGHDVITGTSWMSDSPKLHVEIEGGRMTIRSELDAGETAHVTQPRPKLRHSPATPVPFEPGARHFLQVHTDDPDGLDATLQILEFDDAGRTGGQRYWFAPRHFEPVSMAPTTRKIRLVVRVTGPGRLVLDTLALHVLAGPSPGTAPAAALGSGPHSR